MIPLDRRLSLRPGRKAPPRSAVSTTVLALAFRARALALLRAFGVGCSGPAGLGVGPQDHRAPRARVPAGLSAIGAAFRRSSPSSLLQALLVPQIALGVALVAVCEDAGDVRPGQLVLLR